MAERQRQYIAIDLKSFYASVECVERGLDPLDTHLVVADESRTQKTICLAVSPSLKGHGVPGRPRLFEVTQRVKDVNVRRRLNRPRVTERSSTVFESKLRANDLLDLDFIIAPPRMALYIDYSTRIYKIYLRYVAPEDIHVYSVDEVFIDATPYLATMKMTAHEMAMTMIRDVLRETGITATAGIGTNLYLSKVAMDIVAKKMEPDADGVRIASLDEMSYRRQLWGHRPLTDFWRVGRGISRRLAPYGVQTMGDIARLSLRHEDLLYDLLGVNAELLIDHAWGHEPVDMAHVKAYRPETSSKSSGQVLSTPYETQKALVVIQEMAENLALELLDEGLTTNQLVITIGYDAENLTDPGRRDSYHGDITLDHYGRPVPRHSHGTLNLPTPTLSSSTLRDATVTLFNRIVNPSLLIRRLNLTLGNLRHESATLAPAEPQQLELFTDYEAIERERHEREAALKKERRLMEATLKLKKKFGKNSLLKGLDYQEGATSRDRNRQIGGHQA